MKFNISGVRLVQFTPFTLTGNLADGTCRGQIEPVDTHLFLNGDESDETFEKLMKIGANTCYLHATLGAEVQPNIHIEHNGKSLL